MTLPRCDHENPLEPGVRCARQPGHPLASETGLWGDEHADEDNASRWVYDDKSRELRRQHALDAAEDATWD